MLDNVSDAALVYDPAICGLEVRDAQVCRGKFCVGMQRTLGDDDDDSAVVVAGFLQFLVRVLDVFTCALLVRVTCAAVGTVEYIPLTKSPKVKAHFAHWPSTKRLAERNHVCRSCVEVELEMRCLPMYLV